MIITTIDTETSGLESKDQVVEIALVKRDLSMPLETPAIRWSSLVRPTVPINYDARAAHHITDIELSKAPTMDKVIPILKKHFKESNIIVGHNLEFDIRMLLQSGVPEKTLPAARICTWKCARHLWTDAPRYSNQVLRYFKELDVKVEGPMHRALPDALVTDALLVCMLKETTAEKLIELTSKVILQTKISFGKHRGSLWKDVDPSYLKWLLDPRRQPPFDAEVLHVAQYWLDQRKGK